MAIGIWPEVPRTDRKKLQESARWVVVLLSYHGLAYLIGCANPAPSATFNVRPSIGIALTDSLAEMRSRVEAIAYSLGFEPSSYQGSVGVQKIFPDGRTSLDLSIFQLRTNRQVTLVISRDNERKLGTTLGVYIADYGTRGFDFVEGSVGKTKLNELFMAMRDEFGIERIIFNDWAPTQTQ